MVFERKGQLFNVQPLRKGHGQVNRKNELDIEKYGGYNSATVSYFYLVKYTEKKKKVIALVPIVLHRAADLKTEEAVLNYMTDELELNDPQLLLNGRKIKINTLFEIDGFRAHLSGKSGDVVSLKCAMQLVVGKEWEIYIKRLAKFKEKHGEAERMKKAEYKITKFNDIDKERNQELYELLKGKLKNTAYSVLMKKALSTLDKGGEIFRQLSVENQAIALLHIVELFCCTNPEGKDLRLIEGSKGSGKLTLNTKLTSVQNIKSIYIIDQSPTGLIEHKSEDNLLEL